MERSASGPGHALFAECWKQGWLDVTDGRCAPDCAMHTPLTAADVARPDHPAELGTQQRFHRRPTPARVNVKDGQSRSDDCPQPRSLPVLPPAGFVDVDCVRLLDHGLGFLHDQRQGDTLRLLLAHDRPQR